VTSCSPPLFIIRDLINVQVVREKRGEGGCEEGGGGLLSSSQKISELVENGIGYVCGGQLHLELVSRRSD